MQCERCRLPRPSGDFFFVRLHCRHLPAVCAPCLAKGEKCPDCETPLDERERAGLASKLCELDAVALFAGDGPAGRAPPTEPGFLFFVSGLTGGVREIRLPEGASCLDLKREVERVFRVPPQQQRLFRVADLARESPPDIKALRNGVPVPLASTPLQSGEGLQLVRAYGAHAGQTDIAGAPRDRHGNAAGSAYDLGVDSAFRGLTVAVLHEYTDDGFDFALPEAALREKGFRVHRWSGAVPSLQDFCAVLDRSCQLWIVSELKDCGLTEAHVDRIRRFFIEGHGVYIWGDNAPFFYDANRVALALFGGSMAGNRPGMQIVRQAPAGTATEGAKPGPAGFVPHAITTGLAHLYEGNTIATIQPSPRLHALVRGSAGNVVTALYDREGRRAVLDGGFTRMFGDYWDAAGIARYVKNAAAWLANLENDY